MGLSERIRPAVFRQVGTLPWYGIEYALDDVLVHMYYGYKREHSTQIAAFRGGLEKTAFAPPILVAKKRISQKRNKFHSLNHQQ